MEDTDIERFYGVYLLQCLNPKYKGRTYIGFTVDPNRRIKQHNKGRQFGGAWKTSSKGPWEMCLIVHGFPSDIAALRFEWAWQHPKRSRRLKNLICSKKSSESSFQYCLKIMFTMLRVPPWCRLPLKIRWLSSDLVIDPPASLTPPMHIPILYGPLKAVKAIKQQFGNKNCNISAFCNLCDKKIFGTESIICVNEDCRMTFHILCLAKYFLKNEKCFTDTQPEEYTEQIVPVEGTCPVCESVILWGDLIHKNQDYLVSRKIY